MELPPGWRVAHEVQPHTRRSFPENFRTCGLILRGGTPWAISLYGYGVTGIFTHDIC